MSDLVADHRRARDGFTAITARVRADQWDAPTLCTEWDARALVEHVIGFHDFLLLRPLGVRANRPRTDPAARWAATAAALTIALDEPGVLDRATELPGGGTSTPGTMIGALITDTLVHTWDLARAVALEPALDADLCARALETAPAGMHRDGTTMGPEITIASDADVVSKLIAFYGRDPAWPERTDP